ncbi:MAG: hypothetical protein RR386_07030 [Bacteroidaceae bacterium]
MKKYIILSILLSFFSTSFYAQKEYRQIKRYIKQGGGDLDKAMNAIKEAEKNEERKTEAELYSFAVSAQQRMNDIENEKMYLKQTYDTVRFFSSIYNVFQYAQKCDSLESISGKNGKVRFRYRSKHRSLLKIYYPNVLNAGLFFLKKKNYAEADKYFVLLLNADSIALLNHGVQSPLTVTSSRVAYWSVLSRFNLKNYQTALQYAPIAEADTSVRCQTLELEAKTYKELKKPEKYVETLILGIRQYYQYPFFYPRLIDFYNSNSEYKKSLALTDSMLKMDSVNILYRYAKSVVLMHLKQYRESMDYSKAIIAQDSTYADAYFNVGLCACNQAADAENLLSPTVSPRKYRQEKLQIHEYYKEAKPYVEQYRVLAPQEQAKWAPLLYRIYLSLNLGKQFDEIDMLLKGKK